MKWIIINLNLDHIGKSYQERSLITLNKESEAPSGGTYNAEASEALSLVLSGIKDFR